MKTKLNLPAAIVAGILAGGFTTVTAWAGGVECRTIIMAAADAEEPSGSAVVTTTTGQPHVIIRTIASDAGGSGRKEIIWLGVGVEETSEALASQLDLKPGEGLVVSFVSTNSPAGAAGLRKNDVLVELDGQMLVDPAQLRKLVQMHAEGDSVKVSFFREGKKQSVSAKLAKKAADEMAFDGEAWPGGLAKMQFNLRDLKGLSGGAQGDLNIEIKRAMEQAHRAIQDAMRQGHDKAADAHGRLEIIEKKLGNLAAGGVNMGKSATVTVKNKGESLRTIVKKDESGSYVIVADPAKHLTAHDADGKLLFDGAIETTEDQQKVPKEVWKKVEPMLDDLKKDLPAGGKSSGGGGSSGGAQLMEEN